MGCCSSGCQRTVADEPKPAFSPQCTCDAFKKNRTCRHIPPAALAGAGSAEVPEFSPQCSCAEFKSTGTCKHLPPASAPAAPSRPLPHPSIPELKIEANGAETLPKLELPPFDADLSFGEVIGHGASGAMVLRGTLTRRDGGQEARPLPCAAKVLPLGAATFPDMVEDFGHEVSLMQRLQHPGLVGFFGACRVCTPVLPGVDEAYVLCMELCDDTLNAVIQRRRKPNKPFAPEELGPFVARIAEALGYLHSQGILHRDMKAANVFLLRNTDVRSHAAPGDTRNLPLTAFHAKLGDLGGGKAASRAQTPVQTPQWMAPEVIRLEGYGPPADVWGLGAVIYEMLELGVPYGEEITMARLEQELVAGRRPALADRPGAEARAPAFVALMDACLTAEPSKRPRADDVAKQLQATGAFAQASDK